MLFTVKTWFVLTIVMKISPHCDEKSGCKGNGQKGVIKNGQPSRCTDRSSGCKPMILVITAIPCILIQSGGDQDINGKQYYAMFNLAIFFPHLLRKQRFLRESKSKVSMDSIFSQLAILILLYMVNQQIVNILLRLTNSRCNNIKHITSSSMNQYYLEKSSKILNQSPL